MGSMTNDFVASATVTIQATPPEVWRALTDPDLIRRYFFGTTVDTTWAEGSPITWTGEWQGTEYRDRGIVLEVREPELLRTTHFSPLSGQADAPENYHELTFRLVADGDATVVTLDQDHNPTAEAAEHSRANWSTMLEGLRAVVEGTGGNGP